MEGVSPLRGEERPERRRYVKGQGRILKDGRHVCKAKVGGTGPRRNRPCMRKARAHGYCHKHAKTHVYGAKAHVYGRGRVAQADDHEPARDHSTAGD